MTRRGTARRATTRPRRLVLLVPVALLGAACGDDSVDASQAGEDLPDCSATGCAAEVEAYGDAVAALPEVEEVREIEYVPEQITDGAGISGAVQVGDEAACAAIEDELGRLLWQSPVSPVTAVRLSCYVGSASGSDYEFADYAFVLKDADDLAARWGPRGG